MLYLFIVLPSLIERSKVLLQEHGEPEPEEGSPPEVIVPAFYNFPHAAKMLSLSFVLFAAWYSETTLPVSAYPGLALSGIVSLFGSINVAMPFLLDLARVPADTFQLFVATSVLNVRFGTLTAASHMLVIALVGTYALQGRLRFSAPRLLPYGRVTGALVAIDVPTLDTATVYTQAAPGGPAWTTGGAIPGRDRLPAEPGHAVRRRRARRLRDAPRHGLFASRTRPTGGPP